MSFDDQIGEEESQCPVGTRGGMGWMWGPCACPGWGTDPLESQSPRTTRGASRTGTRPNTFQIRRKESQADKRSSHLRYCTKKIAMCSRAERMTPRCIEYAIWTRLTR